VKQHLAIGLTILAGAALFEAALIPGVVVGGAAVLAPRILPLLRRNLRPVFRAASARTRSARPRPDETHVAALPAAPPNLRFKRALAKTVTFRVIVTSLDFTTNYVVIGEIATAAGLSAFALVAGPLFYLAHETAWNYFGADLASIDLASLVPGRSPETTGSKEVRISQALAKTITFRVIATTMDFAANYVVVGDIAIAAGLSAFGLVVGPFIYLGHEMAWDYYDPPERAPDDDLPVQRPALLASALR
jgi:uncharacterized membrane protein